MCRYHLPLRVLLLPGGGEVSYSVFFRKPILFDYKNKDLKRITQILEQYGNEFKRQFTEHIGKRVDD